MKQTIFMMRAAAAIAVLTAAPSAFSQVQPVAFESFDYAFPGLMGGQNGGTGWLNAWVDDNGNGVVVQADPPTNPTNPFPWGGQDGVGNYCQQAIEFAGLFRLVDPTGHDDVTEANGQFGEDGSTMWFSFTTKQFQQFGDHYGGVSLWEAGVGEKLFLGSPWASYAYGIDDQSGNGGVVIPGTSNANTRRVVVRIDYMAGPERCRMWLDPVVPHPASNPDLDEIILDHRFDEIRISSGGNASLFYTDNLVIEKGEPMSPVGTNYCGPAITNSTGQPGVISGNGSDVAAANNLSLTAEQLPPGQFGYFLAGQTQGFFNPPGSSGIICLSGNIGRYNAPANIIMGPSGTIGVDLTSIPVNPPQAAVAGETWNFQCWYRDAGNTSNFTDGLMIAFQ
ncbi:MAG: hypothetical protein GY711_25590 [bacterium]|nr:hypothetical protein [bacterium]